MRITTEMVDKILRGDYAFPDKHWGHVSDSAKDVREI